MRAARNREGSSTLADMAAADKSGGGAVYSGVGATHVLPAGRCDHAWGMWVTPARGRAVALTAAALHPDGRGQHMCCPYGSSCVVLFAFVVTNQAAALLDLLVGQLVLAPGERIVAGAQFDRDRCADEFVALAEKILEVSFVRIGDVVQS